MKKPLKKQVLEVDDQPLISLAMEAIQKRPSSKTPVKAVFKKPKKRSASEVLVEAEAAKKMLEAVDPDTKEDLAIFDMSGPTSSIFDEAEQMGRNIISTTGSL